MAGEAVWSLEPRSNVEVGGAALSAPFLIQGKGKRIQGGARTRNSEGGGEWWVDGEGTARAGEWWVGGEGTARAGGAPPPARLRSDQEQPEVEPQFRHL
jgi:hypothetical protein